MGRIIKFEASQNYFPDMGKIKSIVPEWYKNIEKFVGGKLKVYPSVNLTVKHCMPFLDTLTSGYYVPLPADVLVETINGNPTITWKSTEDIVKLRNSEFNKNVPVPSGCHSDSFAWQVKMAWQNPIGYSLLVTHPLNRFDLPFVTLSGIMDSYYPTLGGNLPFHIKKGFEGVIPQGTPIAQIIPIKNEKWELKKEEGLYKKASLETNKGIQKILGWYKNKYWVRKNY
jgi:hypothetical protein